uniref:Lactamase_B domain-containing protein n=1 Tax=Meloidogyne hapla TaxID=6305 RepID=A0A1I8BST5_MELHA
MSQINKKGKGSISRVSFEGDDFQDLNDIKFESKINKNEDKKDLQKIQNSNFQPFKILFPPNIEKENNKNYTELIQTKTKKNKNNSTMIDYNGLAKILKNFIKNKKTSINKLNLTNEQNNNFDELKYIILNPKNVKGNLLIEEMPSLNIENKHLKAIPSLIERREENSENNLNLNMNLINNQSNSKSLIIIIREGLARQSDLGYTFVASITLIKDEGKIILVDTGLATDINGRTDLIEKLASNGIAPPANKSLSLTKNVDLIKTPGHTPEDISVIVKNTELYGTIIVAGDTFMTFEDINNSIMWRPQSWNELEQENK